MTGEWLDVIPWVLGAAAVGLSFLVFPGPQAAPSPAPSAGNGSNVIDLAEFRARRANRPQGPEPKRSDPAL